MKNKRFVLIVAFSVFFVSTVSLIQSQEDYDPYQKKTAHLRIKSIKDKYLKKLCSSILAHHNEDKKLSKEMIEIKPKSINSNSALYETDSIYFKIIDKKFVPSKHKISYDPQQSFIQKIDNKYYWGCDGSMPRREIAGFDITINGIKIDIPKKDYNDLFEPNIKKEYSHLYHSVDGMYLIFYMSNSDAAGSYEVMWIFKDGQYLRRVIIDGEC